MGVINLSVLVEKIKRKLLTAGFITSSDKASKSKFGIVKVGDNLSVTSGTVSVPVATESTYGVTLLGASGLTSELIGSKTNVGDSAVNVTLSKPYTDFTFLAIVMVKSGMAFPVSLLLTSVIGDYNYILVDGSSSPGQGMFNKQSGDTTNTLVQIKGTSGSRDFYFYGIK